MNRSDGGLKSVTLHCNMGGCIYIFYSFFLITQGMMKGKT